MSAQLPQILVDDYDVSLNMTNFGTQFPFDEELDTTQFDAPFWSYNTANIVETDLALQLSLPLQPEQSSVSLASPPFNSSGSLSPTSPQSSSSPASYSYDVSQASPAVLDFENQLKSPQSDWDWVQIKDLPFRDHEDSNSPLGDDAASAGLPSPGSGPYSPSSYSPASSPALRDISFNFENLGFSTSPDRLHPTLDDHSVPPSPNMLCLDIPPLQRSKSARMLNSHVRHHHSISDPLFPGYLDTSSARGRARHRANTAPSSRRGSPYHRPQDSDTMRASSPHHVRSFSSTLDGHRREASIPYLRLSPDHEPGPQSAPPISAPAMTSSYPRQSLSIDTKLVIHPCASSPYLIPTPPDGRVGGPPSACESALDSGASEGGSPSISLPKPIVTTLKTRRASEGKRKHEQKFECTICSERFTTKNKRDRHVDAHNGVKRFPCEKEGCPKAFTSSADRKRHSENPKHP